MSAAGGFSVDQLMELGTLVRAAYMRSNRVVSQHPYLFKLIVIVLHEQQLA